MCSHHCEMYPSDEQWDQIYDAMENHLPPPWSATSFHLEKQDTSLPGWNALLQLIEDAAKDCREELSPKKILGPELWAQVITLPPSIAKLKHVKTLDLYRSNLLRIPPEIGEMESLTRFVTYTSYGLHWFPYEITRCQHLKSSTVSTRALYGNYKYRPPFPSLEKVIVDLIPQRCSVCNNTMVHSQVRQFWLSVGVAMDVLPLLVNACSDECIANLPQPPGDYIQIPHKGGLSIQQPLADW